MILKKEILEEFKRITGKDIQSFLKETSDFMNQNYPYILQYFSGKANTLSSIHYKKLQLQKEKLVIMFEGYYFNSQQLVGTRWWDLLQLLEDIDSQFNTIDNIPKWSRSSITEISYSSTVNLDYTLKQNQSLEKVAVEVMDGSGNDWTKIALSNSLKEEDYSLTSQNLLKIVGNKAVKPINIISVVDVIDRKKIYGRDLIKYISFEDEDLVSLDYWDTILQTVDILSNLKRGDNPMEPNEGVQSSIVTGGNRATFNFPILTRQMSQVFSSDDTLKDFQVLSLKIEEDNLNLEYQVYTRVDEVEINNTVNF